MRLFLVCCLLFVVGCTSTSEPKMTEKEKVDFVNSVDEVMDNVKYITVDQESFVKDDDLFTIQVVIITSGSNKISEDGQVVYTNESELDNLDTGELTSRYILHLVQAVQ